MVRDFEGTKYGSFQNVGPPITDPLWAVDAQLSMKNCWHCRSRADKSVPPKGMRNCHWRPGNLWSQTLEFLSLKTRQNISSLVVRQK